MSGQFVATLVLHLLSFGALRDLGSELTRELQNYSIYNSIEELFIVCPLSMYLKP